MKIDKAEKLGLCFGVRRAAQLLKDAANRYGEIETLGPVAHNKVLVENLTRLGIKPVSSLEEVRGGVVAITTHGVSPAVLSQLEARHIQILDATCPIVRKAQNAARRLARSGFYVVIFGEQEHAEVKALLGWAGDKAMAALEPEQVTASGKRFPRLGIISQTTQPGRAFQQFVQKLLELSVNKASEIRIINSLCQVIQAQQEAALRLAGRTELVIVIGSSNSANTRRLVEICSPLVETHLVETADDLDESWLANKERVGITAGASTPEETIDQVISRLLSLSQSAAQFPASEKMKV